MRGRLRGVPIHAFYNRAMMQRCRPGRGPGAPPTGNGPPNTRKGYAAAVSGKAANGGRSTRKGYAAAVSGKAANGGRSTAAPASWPCYKMR